ncbi:MAG: SUF system NifU family Fe-S cluster assembly protein [Bifidobacteriaceae bacterium]|jgi:nitrogen fixation NifU-like protein|nr:SUF system NifU family Fe-S cluster assembly protein [Bifidobacteriaceae bacterium]
MSSLDVMYQDLIMDHAKNPQGKPLQEGFDGESFQVNPVCGDQVRLRVALDAARADGAGTPKLAQISWDGRGCAISQASASIMTELAAGQDLDRVAGLDRAFAELMHSKGAGVDAAVADSLGDAMALEGVSRYPMRVKCALLGWMALRDAVSKAAAGDSSPASVPEGI